MVCCRKFKHSKSNLMVFFSFCFFSPSFSHYNLFFVISSKLFCFSGNKKVDLSNQSPHNVASCFKLFFREMPEPLFTFALYDEFMCVEGFFPPKMHFKSKLFFSIPSPPFPLIETHANDHKTWLKEMKGLIKRLPTPNLIVFHLLFSLLSLLEKQEV